MENADKWGIFRLPCRRNARIEKTANLQMRPFFPNILPKNNEFFDLVQVLKRMNKWKTVCVLGRSLPNLKIFQSKITIKKREGCYFLIQEFCPRNWPKQRNFWFSTNFNNTDQLKAYVCFGDLLKTRMKIILFSLFSSSSTIFAKYKFKSGKKNVTKMTLSDDYLVFFRKLFFRIQS